MRQIPRKNKEGKYSEKFKDNLRMKDFLGQLSESEIKIAGELGLLKWDLWKKAGKVTHLTPEQISDGYKLAPVFGKKYSKNQKFAVSNYDELGKFEANP